jgi:ATP-dependent Clp protease ATP-binding subunit ClpB
MAGSGIRGQFEEKFKNLIRDIEDEVSPTHACMPDEMKASSFIRGATPSVS